MRNKNMYKCVIYITSIHIIINSILYPLLSSPLHFLYSIEKNLFGQFLSLKLLIIDSLIAQQCYFWKLE